MKQKSILITLLLFFSLQTFSQTKHSCKAKEQNDIYFKRYPKSKIEYLNFNTFTKKYTANQHQKKAASTYTIPVVFHVYGATQNGATVTTEKIKIALQKLNDDFQGLNADFKDVDPYFNSIKSTLSIEFKLAQLDPNGNCTTGVIYYDEKSGYGNGGGYDSQISNDAWDNYKYMNVYLQGDLYADGSTSNSGVAWYPNSAMSDANTARVVYNGAYLHGNTGDEFASVLTHEFGHFFNLIHTFEGGCTYPNDEVSDTPPEDASTVGANCSPIKNCEGNFINYENYMGYNGAADGCYRMFTKGQTDRMLAALQHPARQTLWKPQNLIDTGVHNSGASFSINNNIFKESINNNGTFNQTTTVTVNGTNFNSSGAILTPEVDYSLPLPQGLSATIQTTSNTTATITITGTASNHTAINNQTLTLNFKESALASNQNLACSSISLKLKFYDPFEIIYEDFTDVSADSTNGWKFFYLPKINGEGSYGAWHYKNGHLKMETYGKKLVTNTASRNIALLTKDELISTTSNFTEPGAYPDQLDLRTENHTEWDGNTGYIGFSAIHNDETVLGWMQVTVSTDGNTMIVQEYAFSTKPNGDILAGQTTLNNTIININAPSNLTASDATSSEITLNWNDNSDNEEGFKIERLNNNGSYSLITTIGANSTTYTDSSLTANTTYSYRIQSFSGNAHSTYSNIAEVTTADHTQTDNYCAINGNNDYEYIQAISINSFINSSGADTNGYGNYTSKIIDLPPSANVNVSLTPGFLSNTYSEHWAIYIDYNQNNLFETDERVLDGISGNTTVSGSFLVSEQAVGITRMRIIMKYDSTPIDGCLPIGDGEAEDYTVSFSEAVIAPSNLSAIANSTSKITLNWQDNSTNENGFRIERVTNSGSFEVISSVPTNTNSFTDTNLTENTTYTYRVRAFVNNIDSTPSNEVSITTNSNANTSYCNILGDSAYEYIQTVSIGNFVNTSTANTNGYGDYTHQKISLIPGSNATINLTPGFSSTPYTQYWAVYIDYNKNNIFEANEQVVNGIHGTTSVSRNFIVESSAAGTTRMRVIMKYYSAPNDACTAIGAGEIEDYTIEFASKGNTPSLALPLNIRSAGAYNTGFYAAWDTVSDIDSYEVQLLNNGNWEMQGTSSSYYLWIERKTTISEHTFRVRATNGVEYSKWSTPLTISLPSQGPRKADVTNLSIYPNPAIDYIYIKGDKKSFLSIQIFSLQGKKIGHFTNTDRISVQHLPKGTYLLKINTSKDSIIRKIIIQ
ncbi:M43 family zinc metalloprotease [Tenacibaculum maritimum]|uniref:M43 family zinc metalloprotease n=1 Tax=Tenacibaculum maritimum TaxID=107401 RepID=UPI0010A3BA7C|nr:M43 family zinc metalloprotease [Tenacibaculum maritimum]QCD61772.1 hypothetical protein B9C57_04065 [Tenacibaculum maritimum]